MSESQPLTITAENFEEEVLKSDEPVLVDFWAPWCGPCRAIGPALEELAQHYGGKVKVCKINVDEEPELAATFEVRGIPALFAMNEGEVVDQMIGWGGKQRLIDAFEALASMNKEKDAA